MESVQPCMYGSQWLLPDYLEQEQQRRSCQGHKLLPQQESECQLGAFTYKMVYYIVEHMGDGT